MSQDWTSGYVTDIDYEVGFFRELAPAWIDLALILRGLRAPSASAGKGFSYGELGCGHGLSITLTAAANPHAQFFANDFNPAHIASAKRLAQSASLGNLTFSDQSFEEYGRADLPQLDYITLHGVYSWVSDENRKHIAHVIRQRLAPGGVVYVSYNSLPGRSSALPLRKLLSDCAGLLHGPTAARIKGSLAFAERIANLKLGYLAKNPDAARRLREIIDEPINYVAHEYFNRDWTPQYFAEVVSELSEAKLVFATSADVHDGLDTPGGEAGQNLLDEVPDPIFRETVRDFLRNSQFRRDLFAKGLSRMSALEQRTHVPALRFALTRVLTEPLTQATIGSQPISLKQEIYAPLLSALHQGPKTFSELSALPEIARLGPNHEALALQALVILVGSGDALVCVPEQAAAAARPVTDRLNQVLLEEAEQHDRIHALSSPVTGTGIHVSWIEQLFIRALGKGIDPVEHAWTLIKRHGRRLRKKHEQLESDEQNVSALREKLDGFLERRVPALKHLGVL